MSRLGLSSAVGVFLVGLAIWDFTGFAGRAADVTPAAGLEADAVVALTGGSGLRIATGVDLVTAGQGERLLVSGVNRAVTLPELEAMAGGASQTYACCVDMGFEAETTIGNAEETATWADTHDYTSLIVVTSDYHMPRSLLLLARAMPNTELKPYPVRTSIDPRSIWSEPASFRGVALEWLKWRLTTVGG